MEKRNYYPVGWFEIYVQDIQRAKQFYEAVFQLELTDLADPTNSGEENEMKMVAFPYSMEDLPGASGALVQMGGYPSGGNSVIVYFSSVDCSIEQARAVGAGGRLIQAKTSLGEHGFMSLCEDTEGNVFGLHSMV